MNSPKMQFLSAVSPQPGNLYTEVMFKKPRKTLSFKESSALEIRVFPFGFGAFKLTWSEYVNDRASAENAKKPDGTKKYDSFRDFLNSDVVIGYRTEYVPFFKEVESHPFVVQSTSSIDGVSTEIVITIVTRIKFPENGGALKILALNDPFGYVFGFINEAILRWANSKTSKQVRAMNTDETTNPLDDEIEIEGEYYLDYLNRETFKHYEIEVTNVNLKAVFLSKEDKAVLDAEKKVVIGASEASAAVEKKKERETLSEAKNTENNVAAAFLERKLNAKAKFIKDSGQSLKEINSGYGANNAQLKVLALGDNNKLLTELITATEAVNNSD
jgi:hypothetical protein